MQQPKRLIDLLAEQLLLLHATNFYDCPVKNHTELFLANAKHNMQNGTYNKLLLKLSEARENVTESGSIFARMNWLQEKSNKDHFPDSFGYKSPEEAWAVIEAYGHLLQCNTLLHGDYCLPNIMLDDWRFSGFVDLDAGGVGDPHVDIFWMIWSLEYNFKTDKYRERFLDAYGRSKVNEDMLRLVAAVEVFG